jgi:hypothetical protein
MVREFKGTFEFLKKCFYFLLEAFFLSDSPFTHPIQYTLETNYSIFQYIFSSNLSFTVEYNKGDLQSLQCHFRKLNTYSDLMFLIPIR